MSSGFFHSEMMDLSIVIVNWNTRNLLNDCLKSINDTVRDMTFEIIVVDNASDDGSAQMVREEFPEVTLIENKENRGFGAANNQAFAIMRGSYALLLNTDVVLTDNAIYDLFSFMETHPGAAMACGQLLNRDGSKQNSIANFPTLLTLMTNISLLEYLFPKRFPSKRYKHTEPIEIESAIGACLIVRKKAMDEVGIFDEGYFFFFEETDWAYRMRSAGWKIYHIPSTMIYHLQGQSIGRNVRSRIEYYRSRYHFFKKWKSSPYTVAIYIVIILRLMVNWLLTTLANAVMLSMNAEIRNKWVVYSQLILWHLKGCP